VKKLFLTCAILALTPGCMHMQRVTIHTSTPGAQIVIVKRGEIRTRNTVVGAIKVGTVEAYEDQPVIVGTSPMVYDFQRVEDKGGWGIPPLFWQQQKRVCQWLEIRASSPGENGQQMIPVNGDDAAVFLQMTPAPMPAAHAATSVPQPRS
jgi:hypothetical protein